MSSGAISECSQTSVHCLRSSISIVSKPKQEKRPAAGAYGEEPTIARVRALEGPDGDLRSGGAEQQPLLVGTAAAGGNGLAPQLLHVVAGGF